MTKKTKRKPRKAFPPQVSLGGIFKEELPFPYVHYPRHYGTFLRFLRLKVVNLISVNVQLVQYQITSNYIGSQKIQTEMDINKNQASSMIITSLSH